MAGDLGGATRGCCATQTLSAKPLILSHLYFASKLLYFWLHPVSSRCIQKSVYDSLVVSLLNIVDTSKGCLWYELSSCQSCHFKICQHVLFTHRVDSVWRKNSWRANKQAFLLLPNPRQPFSPSGCCIFPIILDFPEKLRWAHSIKESKYACGNWQKLRFPGFSRPSKKTKQWSSLWCHREDISVPPAAIFT